MTEEDNDTGRRKRSSNLPTDTSPPTHVLVSTETFNHVVRSLRNSTEAILNITEEVSKLSQDCETLKAIAFKVAENQASLGSDIKEIHRAVAYNPPTTRIETLKQSGQNGGGNLSGDTLRQALNNLEEDEITQTPLSRAGQQIGRPQ
jgi:hypothetical protein